MGRLARVKQWLLFARQWHILDATGQDLWLMSEKVSKYLSGRHKPIHHPQTDCGDHVVVINCKDIAMHGFDWKDQKFFFDKEMPKSKEKFAAWQIHEYDPCRLVAMAVLRKIEVGVLKRKYIERLHLFAGNTLPDFVKNNISAQMEQIQPVPKRSDEYTADERARFPRFFKFDENHFVDWERPVDNPGQWTGKDRSPFNQNNN